jgi:hypothetical protein
MRINDNAEGIHIKTKDFEKVIAVRIPNADTKIVQEFWFKGKAKCFQKKKLKKEGNSSQLLGFEEKK